MWCLWLWFRGDTSKDVEWIHIWFLIWQLYITRDNGMNTVTIWYNYTVLAGGTLPILCEMVPECSLKSMDFKNSVPIDGMTFRHVCPMALRVVFLLKSSSLRVMWETVQRFRIIDSWFWIDFSEITFRWLVCLHNDTS